MLYINSFFFFKLIPILASLSSCVLCPVFCEKSIPFVVGDGGTKGGRKQLLAFSLASLVIELQNLDDTGGRRKNICPWDIAAGRELPFFFFSPFIQMFWIMGDKRCLKICKCFAVTYKTQQYYSRLHLSYTLAKKHLFKTFLTPKSSDKRAAMLQKKQKCVI